MIIPGFGDYEAFPNTGHPLDPRNDADDYPEDEDDEPEPPEDWTDVDDYYDGTGNI